MKMLLSTTALVVALGLPTLTLAESAASATNTTTQQTQQNQGEMSGFLSSRTQSDLLASELMGHHVYARRTPGNTAATGAQTRQNADGTRRMAMINRTDLNDMDNIGQVNEIVISDEGQVRGLVIGVGGFLGLGERDVAVTMDQVTFALDPDDRTQMFIVVNTGAEMLRGSPRFERMAAVRDTNAQTAAEQGTGSRTAFRAPDMNREGYTRLAATDVSVDLLMGKTVYGVNDNSVGTVRDMLMDDSGSITNVIIDFGGFLGIGSSQVSVGYDELTILSNSDNSDVRVYIDATREQVQAQPQYRASN